VVKCSVLVTDLDAADPVLADYSVDERAIEINGYSLDHAPGGGGKVTEPELAGCSQLRSS
jgi:hypothetical protein